MNKKKSICLVGLDNIPVLAPEYNQHGVGGEPVQQTLIARALARKGHAVSMVVGDFGQRDGATWDGVVTHKAYRAAAGLPVLRFFHPRFTGLWSALRRADADVYYTSCAGMQVGILALFARIHGRRVIYRVASDSDCEPDQLLIRYRRDRKLYEYGLRRADAVLAQSEKQRAALRKNYRRESIVAGMLVDGPTAIRPFDARDIPVLWVSNIRSLKRPDLLLELAARAPSVSMHMAGGPMAGSEALYDEIRTQATALGNVVFHGPVPYHDVSGLFDRARVFVNTSDVEGFPNSYLQAWIRGIPVVAIFDPDSIIAREGLGRCVRNVDEMHAAVLHYLNNPDEWQQASQRCLDFMRTRFGEDTILAPYLDAMNGATGSRP